MDKFEKVYNSYKFGKIVLYKEIKKNYRIQEKKNTPMRSTTLRPHPRTQHHLLDLAAIFLIQTTRVYSHKKSCQDSPMHMSNHTQRLPQRCYNFVNSFGTTNFYK